MAVNNSHRRMAATLGSCLPPPDGVISAFDRASLLSVYETTYADHLTLNLSDSTMPSDALTKHFYKRMTEAPVIILDSEAILREKRLFETIQPLDWIKLKLHRPGLSPEDKPTGTTWTTERIQPNTPNGGFTG